MLKIIEKGVKISEYISVTNLSSNGYNYKTIDKAIIDCTSTSHQHRKKTSITRLVLPFIDDKLANVVQAVIRNSGQSDLGVA